jgi:lysophospholipase L1-like esterase
MDQLPYPLDYMHKFNVHKWLGLNVADDDLASIARMYGVRPGELKRVERRLQENVVRLAARLAESRGGGAGTAAAPITVLALGDSISSDRESFVRILNRYWQGTSRTVVDCAVSGNTTSDIIDRLYITVMNQSFDWVVLFVGTNDCRQPEDEEHFPVTSLQEYRRNMQYLIRVLQKHGKQVILVTLPPVDNRRLLEFLGPGRIYDQHHIDSTNQALRELASSDGLKIADLAAALASQDEDVLTPDGLHLNDAGQLILCGLLLDIMP